MANAEAEILANEAKAELEAQHMAAIMATADSQGIDVRAFKAQQEGTSLLRVEHDVDEENIHEFEDEMQKAREQMEYQREMREAEIAKKGKDDEERERWLSAREDGVTTPRTKARGDGTRGDDGGERRWNTRAKNTSRGRSITTTATARARFQVSTKTATSVSLTW